MGFNSAFKGLRPRKRSCEWQQKQPSARLALHILVYLQVTLVSVKQLKPTFVYTIWLDTWRKVQTDRVWRELHW